MIPEAAVESVARMLWENYEHAVSWEQSKEFDKVTARWILEAAALHMMRAAWNEGFAECKYDDIAPRPNPYRIPR